MNAVTIPGRSISRGRSAIGFAVGAWRATTRRQWAWALLIGCVVALAMLPHRFDTVQKLGWHTVPMVTEMLLPLLAAVPMFLGWVLADAGSDAWRSRRTRLAYALIASGAVATLLTIGLWHLSGAGPLWDQYAASKGRLPKSGALMVVADYIRMLVIGGMIYAVAEVACQRSRTRLAFEAASRQQVALEQELLESKLAAMQAQVEPRFLFDTLVDIEALYEKDAPRAAEDLDRLIAFLRAALPRLRESGSSIEAELELVQTYLAVVASLRGGRPRLNIAVAEDCRRERFYPMLLLPLVQRAVRQGALPATIDIDVRREAGGPVIALHYDAAGGCADDSELARVRERLAALYGKAAALDCIEADGATELTMRLPAAAATGR